MLKKYVEGLIKFIDPIAMTQSGHIQSKNLLTLIISSIVLQDPAK